MWFGPFELDTDSGVLRRRGEVVDLTPKAHAVLCHLVARAGALVTKDELWRAVWPRAAVTDAALTVCISEVRRALGDAVEAPAYIATVHRRGYRFIAPVTRERRPELAAAICDDVGMPAAVADQAFVGRGRELLRLNQCWAAARRGDQQIVFIAGEPGIGKTALAERFLRVADGLGEAWITRGQSIEQAGVAEAFLPLLDALARLARTPARPALLTAIVRHAPGWLSLLPSLQPDAGTWPAPAVKDPVAPGRMLREFTELVEAIAGERPLVLLFDDLHWCDRSTLDWLSFIGRRHEATRLMVLASYRPLESAVLNPPLRRLVQDLSSSRACTVVELGGLRGADIAEFLAVRPTALPRQPMAANADLARRLRQRTGGNPLFVINLLDYLDTHDASRAGGDALAEAVASVLPESLRQLINGQFERLDADARNLLRAASIVGASFSAAAVAAVADIAPDIADDGCARLAEDGRFVVPDGIAEWPDGTVAGRYRFVHALYRETLYESVAPARRAEWHRRLARRLAEAYGQQWPEIAVDLARHHEFARDLVTAAACLLRSGETSLVRNAYLDAIAHFEHGLALLAATPGQHGAELRLALHLALGPALISTQGSASAAVAACYETAFSLAGQVNDDVAQFQALFGQRSSALARGELSSAHEIGARLALLAEATSAADLLLAAYLAVGNTAFQLGELRRARRHLEAALDHYPTADAEAHRLRFGMDGGMFCLSLLAITLQLLGLSGEAQRRSDEALALDQRLSHKFTNATAANFAAWFHQLRDEPATCAVFAQNALQIAQAAGFSTAEALASIRLGWARCMLGEATVGLPAIDHGLTLWQTTGTALGRPHFLALSAMAKQAVGQIDAATVDVDAALAEIERTGERWVLAEVHRLRAGLSDAAGHGAAATEAEYRRAIACAKRQGARYWEDRARASLLQATERRRG